LLLPLLLPCRCFVFALAVPLFVDIAVASASVVGLAVASRYPKALALGLSSNQENGALAPGVCLFIPLARKLEINPPVNQAK
jgi:hypothetical protein